MPSLSRRIEALEGGVTDKRFGAVILTHEQETESDAVARYEGEHGAIDGEVLFIRLMGFESAA